LILHNIHVVPADFYSGIRRFPSGRLWPPVANGLQAYIGRNHRHLNKICWIHGNGRKQSAFGQIEGNHAKYLKMNDLTHRTKFNR
jgi:hypothetical protein